MDILVNNAGLALGTQAAHQNVLEVTIWWCCWQTFSERVHHESSKGLKMTGGRNGTMKTHTVIFWVHGRCYNKNISLNSLWLLVIDWSWWIPIARVPQYVFDILWGSAIIMEVIMKSPRITWIWSKRQTSNAGGRTFPLCWRQMWWGLSPSPGLSLQGWYSGTGMWLGQV